VYNLYEVIVIHSSRDNTELIYNQALAVYELTGVKPSNNAGGASTAGNVNGEDTSNRRQKRKRNADPSSSTASKANNSTSGDGNENETEQDDPTVAKRGIFSKEMVRIQSDNEMKRNSQMLHQHSPCNYTISYLLY
jgi:hypothetical protein